MLNKQTATLQVNKHGSLRIAVVADTHSAPHPATKERLVELRPDAILHAGDIGDLGVLDLLAEVAPVFAVRGNIDVRAKALPDVLTLEVRSGDALALRILLLHIGVNGPKLRADAARLAHAQRAALVVCGHSHVPFIGKDRGVGVFNPGSIGPRRFQLPIVLGAIDITPSEVRLRHVDCATGRVWTPPNMPAHDRSEPGS
jgi:putative phosphoesterase